jgi:hypothetical protein
VDGHAITIRLPQAAGITCMTMGFGTVTVRLLRTAGLRNPSRKGTYDFTVVVGARALLGTFAIT